MGPSGNVVEGTEKEDSVMIRATVEAPESGIYEILVSSGSSTGGTYNLFLGVFPRIELTSSDVGEIKSGETREGSLFTGEFDITPIEAIAGEAILVTIDLNKIQPLSPCRSRDLPESLKVKIIANLW